MKTRRESKGRTHDARARTQGRVVPHRAAALPEGQPMIARGRGRPTALEVRAAGTIIWASLGPITKSDRRAVADARDTLAGQDPFDVLERARRYRVQAARSAGAPPRGGPS